MAQLDKATADQEKLLIQVMQQHHTRLVDARANILMLQASAPEDAKGESKGCAIKVYGVPAYAKVRVCSTEQRIAGSPDAIITIDADRWGGLATRERLALLDQQLTRIALKKASAKKGGYVKCDSLGRPSMGLRPFDHALLLFDEVARRWGVSSQEHQQVRRFVNDNGQLYLHGIADDDAVEVTTPAKVPARAVQAELVAANDATVDPKVVLTGMLAAHKDVGALIGRLDDADVGASTKSAIYHAELARTGKGRPRSKLLDPLAQHSDATPDWWSGILVAPVLDAGGETQLRAAIPLAQDAAALRWVASVENKRRKSKRAWVGDLVETRLMLLLEHDSGDGL